MRKTIHIPKKLLRNKRSRSNGSTSNSLDYSKIEAARGILKKKRTKILHLATAVRAEWR